MKSYDIPIIIAIFAIGIVTGHYINVLVERQERQENNGILFIWNDDEESIPVDGSLIRLQYTDENTVYIGPADLTDTDVSYIKN